MKIQLAMLHFDCFYTVNLIGLITRNWFYEFWLQKIFKEEIWTHKSHIAVLWRDSNRLIRDEYWLVWYDSAWMDMEEKLFRHAWEVIE